MALPSKTDTVSRNLWNQISAMADTVDPRMCVHAGGSLQDLRLTASRRQVSRLGVARRVQGEQIYQFLHGDMPCSVRLPE